MSREIQYIKYPMKSCNQDIEETNACYYKHRTSDNAVNQSDESFLLVKKSNARPSIRKFCNRDDYNLEVVGPDDSYQSVIDQHDHITAKINDMCLYSQIKKPNCWNCNNTQYNRCSENIFANAIQPSRDPQPKFNQVPLELTIRIQKNDYECALGANNGDHSGYCHQQVKPIRFPSCAKSYNPYFDYKNPHTINSLMAQIEYEDKLRSSVTIQESQTIFSNRHMYQKPLLIPQNINTAKFNGPNRLSADSSVLYQNNLPHLHQFPDTKTPNLSAASPNLVTPNVQSFFQKFDTVKTLEKTPVIVDDIKGPILWIGDDLEVSQIIEGGPNFLELQNCNLNTLICVEYKLYCEDKGQYIYLRFFYNNRCYIFDQQKSYIHKCRHNEKHINDANKKWALYINSSEGKISFPSKNWQSIPNLAVYPVNNEYSAENVDKNLAKTDDFTNISYDLEPRFLEEYSEYKENINKVIENKVLWIKPNSRTHLMIKNHYFLQSNDEIFIANNTLIKDYCIYMRIEGNTKHILIAHKLSIISSSFIWGNFTLVKKYARVYDQVKVGESNIIGENCFLSCNVTIEDNNFFSSDCCIQEMSNIGSGNIFDNRCLIGEDGRIGNKNTFERYCDIGKRNMIGDYNYFEKEIIILDDGNVGSGLEFYKDTVTNTIVCKVNERFLNNEDDKNPSIHPLMQSLEI